MTENHKLYEKIEALEKMSEEQIETIAEMEEERHTLFDRKEYLEGELLFVCALNERLKKEVAELKAQLKEVIEDTLFELCEDCEIRAHQHQFPDHKRCEECYCCKGCDCCECDQLAED